MINQNEDELIWKYRLTIDQLLIGLLKSWAELDFAG
jgi:hypothetical protein